MPNDRVVVMGVHQWDAATEIRAGIISGAIKACAETKVAGIEMRDGAVTKVAAITGAITIKVAAGIKGERVKGVRGIRAINGEIRVAIKVMVDGETMILVITTNRDTMQDQCAEAAAVAVLEALVDKVTEVPLMEDHQIIMEETKEAAAVAASVATTKVGISTGDTKKKRQDGISSKLLVVNRFCPN